MNRYVGDFTPGKTVRLMFNTNQADGTPITLAGTPAVSVYKDASTTESTTGVSLTVDFDSRTGLHQAVIDTSADGTFYAAGSDFRAVLTAGTVDGVSVVGAVVGGFSLANRSALRPTTADRTLDVSSGGEAGIDWANVGSPTTSLNLSGTTISTSQAVASVSGAVASVTGAVGSVTGSVGSVGTGGITSGSFAAGAIDSAAIATDAIGALELAAGAASEVAAAVWDLATSGHTTGGTFGAAMNAAGSAGDPWATALPGSYIAGTAGYILGTNLDAAITSRSTPGAAWDTTISGHTTPGTFGAKMNNVSVGDPMAINLPGGYVAGQAGYIIGTFLDLAVSSRLATSGYSAPLSASGVRAAVGLASANLDTQLGTLATATNLGTLQTTATAIKAKTDNLPSGFPTNFASLAITVGGGVTAATVGDKTGYSLNLAQTGLSPRALDAVADSALTVGDALTAAICGAAGKESTSGTSYLVKTPSTGTTIRSFTLDDSTNPTSRS